MSIALPPLRERKQDILPLVKYFLTRTKQPVSITPAALSLLCDHNWPGNVRELENTIARALVLARGDLIDKSDIQLLSEQQGVQTRDEWTSAVPLHSGWKQNIDSLERSMVCRALAEAGGNKSKRRKSWVFSGGCSIRSWASTS